jgi:hypothetical protein
VGRLKTLTLNPDGFLNPGVHEATLDEIRGEFGGFQESDQRPKLYKRLEQLVDQLKVHEFVKFIVVDGSFVTSKAAPGDIDVIVVVDPAIFTKDQWTPDEYNVLSSKRLKRRYKFDVLVAGEGSGSYDSQLRFFSRVKDGSGSTDDQEKGVVRLSL